MATVGLSVIISTGAAAVSAICAFLSFWFSRKMSERDMLNLVKVEILKVVSSARGQADWIQEMEFSKTFEGGGVGVRVNSLASLLGRKYKRKKWVSLIPPALEELKKEGHQKLLGMSDDSPLI